MKFVEAFKSWKDLWKYRGKVSYSQCGEDLIVAFLLLETLKIRSPYYLDIGAHHPIHLSNTYLFYRQGCEGVCVEPDPALCKKIRRIRKRDVCINAGIGTEKKDRADFYVLSARTLNTFSKYEADAQVRTSDHRIENVIQIPLAPVNQIIEDHFKSCPNYISLDTEGMDLEILKAFDFERFRPEVFCVETLTHPHLRKVTEIDALMREKGYTTYADTFINTIFVNKHAWTNNKSTGAANPSRFLP